MGAWPGDPGGDMVPVLEASIEAEQAKQRHPSGADVAATTQIVLTAGDRADCCSSAAVFQVYKPNDGLGDGNTLMFCGHHWRKNKALMPHWTVVGVNPELA